MTKSMVANLWEKVGPVDPWAWARLSPINCSRKCGQASWHPMFRKAFDAQEVSIAYRRTWHFGEPGCCNNCGEWSWRRWVEECVDCESTGATFGFGKCAPCRGEAPGEPCEETYHAHLCPSCMGDLCGD